MVAVDVGGEGGDGGEGLADFGVLFFEDDAEVFVEEDGDLEDVDGVEAEAELAEDGSFGSDGFVGEDLETEAFGEDLDEFFFGWGHGDPFEN